MWEKLKQQWGIQKKYTKQELDDAIKAAITGTVEGTIEYLKSDNLKAVFTKSGKDVPGCEIVAVGEHPIFFVKRALDERGVVFTFDETDLYESEEG